METSIRSAKGERNGKGKNLAYDSKDPTDNDLSPDHHRICLDEERRVKLPRSWRKGKPARKQKLTSRQLVSLRPCCIATRDNEADNETESKSGNPVGGIQMSQPGTEERIENGLLEISISNGLRLVRKLCREAHGTFGSLEGSER